MKAKTAFSIIGFSFLLCACGSQRDDNHNEMNDRHTTSSSSGTGTYNDREYEGYQNRDSSRYNGNRNTGSQAHDSMGTTGSTSMTTPTTQGTTIR